MRFRIAVLMMAVAATAAWSEPSLVLLDRADLPIARDRVTVLRELTDQVFVAADSSSKCWMQTMKPDAICWSVRVRLGGKAA
jgi:hypothetical protein